MKKVRAAVAAALAAGSSVALAAGDSGTSSMGEMQVSGSMFGLLVGGLVGLGVIIWLVAKVANK